MSYSEVLRQRTVFGYLLALAFGFSVMLIFLTNSPFVYMEYFGVSERVFSVLFLMNVLGLIAINRLNSYLLKKHGPAVLLVRFIQMQLCGAIILLLSVTFFPQHMYGVIAGFIIMVSANAGIMPNTNACYLQYFKQKHFQVNGGIIRFYAISYCFYCEWVGGLFYSG